MSAVRPRILVIDDEPQIHRFLSPALDAAGYDAKRADSGQEGLRAIALWSPDAVVLDLGLPDMDGKDVLKRAREFYAGPVIILSARDKEAEKIEALDLGANDYVEKPFGIGELLARIRVALRQGEPRAEVVAPRAFGDLALDLEFRRVLRDGRPVHLTPKEFELFALLAAHANKVVTHHQALTQIWGPAHHDDVQYLRVVIAQLRAKLEADPARPLHLLNEAGIGYRLVE